MVGIFNHRTLNLQKLAGTKLKVVMLASTQPYNVFHERREGEHFHDYGKLKVKARTQTGQNIQYKQIYTLYLQLLEQCPYLSSWEVISVILPASSMARQKFVKKKGLEVNQRLGQGLSVWCLSTIHRAIDKLKAYGTCQYTFDFNKFLMTSN